MVEGHDAYCGLLRSWLVRHAGRAVAGQPAWNRDEMRTKRTQVHAKRDGSVAGAGTSHRTRHEAGCNEWGTHENPWRNGGPKCMGPRLTHTFPTDYIFSHLDLLDSNNLITGLDRTGGIHPFPAGLDGTLPFAPAFPHSSNLFSLLLEDRSHLIESTRDDYAKEMASPFPVHPPRYHGRSPGSAATSTILQHGIPS